MSDKDAGWVELEFEPEVKGDLKAHLETLIKSGDRQGAGRLYRAYNEALDEIRLNPFHGGELEGPLAGCRKVYLDDPGHDGKPRFRLVYELEPSEGAPAIARIRGVVLRAAGIGYRVVEYRRRGN